MSELSDLWDELKSSAQTAVEGNFPIEGRVHKLVLNKVDVDEKKAQPNDIRGQEKAKELGRSWGANVVGDVSLVEKATGKTLSRSKMKLFTLPKPTERYSYIVDGKEWQVDNLWRLNPGAYARRKADGGLETEIAMAKPFARESRLRIPFNPNTKKLKFRMGQTNYSLYPVLKMMGVSDEEMKKSWGEDIYEANVEDERRSANTINDLYTRASERGVKASGDSLDDKATALAKEFDQTELSPAATKLTLGKEFDKVNGEALLASANRVLSVARGESEPDDRDSLIFKDLRGIEDFLSERLSKRKTQRDIRLKIRNNLDRKTDVRDVLSSDVFGRPVKQAFTSSSLARNPEQVNPIEILSNYRITTTIGGEEGGIKDEQTLAPGMKLINPSHMGFLDPIHTPESGRTGISLNLPTGVRRSRGKAQAPVYDLKENKLKYVTPSEINKENIILPDQVSWDRGTPKPIASEVKMKDAETQEILKKPAKEARYVFPSSHQLFDEATNLIPFLQNNQGNRTMTASRQASQAVGLRDREEPLVQVQAGNRPDLTWEELVAVPFTQKSPVDGEIVKIRKDRSDNGYADSVVVKDANGKRHEVQLYNHFPVNDSKSYMHSDPIVNIGDKVSKGQRVADTNFTRNGKMAVGTNLKVSYMPYKGYNFEDGIVISDSASRKLTSEHVYRKDLEVDPKKDMVGKDKFGRYASASFRNLTSEQRSKIADDGVVPVGTKVDPGDVLVAAVGKRDQHGMASRMMSRLDPRAYAYQDKSVRWDSESPGEVVKVVKSPNGKNVSVHVKTQKSAEVGDKIVGRHGNKSIITRIIPDHEMPRIGESDGEHTEVLMNPSGVPSRINLGQMLETAASKVARKTGKPYVVNNFGGPDEDYSQKVKDDLKKYGLSDTEEIFDPATKRKLGDVLTGDQYIMKLQHQVEKKLATRSPGHGASYTIDGAPKGTGAEHPGQGIGQLEFYSLLAHGARKNLKEMATYKADRQVDEKMNPQAHLDFWARVQNGQPLPAPKPTFAYKKFDAYLKGLGLDTKKKGSQLQLVPLTDKGVLGLSNGEIKDPGLAVRGKDAKELEKGLFDPQITGGLPDMTDVGKGLKWSHITLAEPMPNPTFVGTPLRPGPAVVLSGMSHKDFEDVVTGKKKVEGKTGGAAIKERLDSIDTEKELEDLKKELPNLRGNALNKANRKAKYLRALNELKMKPSEAYMMNHVPVLPPVFRPLVPLPDGSLRYDDVNHLYKNLGIVNNKLKNPIAELPEEEDQPLREEMYDILKATMGVGGNPQYESNRKLRGILDTVAGPVPKQGYFQKRLMKRRQDLSMRSTIIPEPTMDLDRVGIPRQAAMDLYKPFVVRELRRRGLSMADSMSNIKKNTEMANQAMEKAIDERPMMLKRDPALHRYSFMAFKPQLVEGKAIRIHPLVTAGYNADFDGDTMSGFVPLTDDAVREARKMFPSNNLFSSTTGGIMHVPEQESLLGLHLLSKWDKDTDKQFSSLKDARKAYNAGTITPNDGITVQGKRTTLGRLLLAKNLPKKFQTDNLLHNKNFVLNKKRKEGGEGLVDLLTDVAKEDPKNYAPTVDKLKNLGNEFSYNYGFSVSLNDLGANKQVRDQILSQADAKAERIKNQGLPPEQKDAKLIDVYSKATEDMEKKLRPQFAQSNNNIYTMVDSGTRGKWSQFRQMNIAPMLMQDASGRTIPSPVRKSYSEGLDVGDYWTALHGARMGTIQRVEGSSEPGQLTKEVVNAVLPELAVSKDCKTTEGVSMGINDDDVYDRFLAKSVKAGNKQIPSGTLVTPELTSELKKNRVDRVVVRSPLKCKHGRGLCSTCYGLDENGELPAKGTNLGVIAGHSMGEPAMQLAMDSFHTGGVSGSRGAGATSRIGRLRQLIQLPTTLPGSATLSQAGGKVQKIEKDPGTQGWNITVGGKKHFAPAERKPLYNGKDLQVGTNVKKGDPLTDGLVNPRELLPLSDINTVQNHLVSELYDGIYRDERVRRRNIETVVRTLTNLAQVEDPGDTDHLGGDLTLRTVIEEKNRQLPPGARPAKARPVLKGLNRKVIDQEEDWMAKLNFQYLKDSLLEGAAKGWKTDLHGLNPVPGYAFGAEFGEGTSKDKHLY